MAAKALRRRVGFRAPVHRAMFSSVPQTWRGMPPGIFMWPMALATLGWPSSTRTASSSSPGAREETAQGNSTRFTA